jgi:hypothetical protein
VLSRKYGPEKDEVTGWRKVNNEKLHNLHSSPNIIMVINSRIRWTGHVMHMEEMTNARSLNRKTLEDLDIYGSITLNCTLKKWGVRMWTGVIWFRIWTSGNIL